MTDISRGDLEKLLALADNVVDWTAQDTLKPDAAGYRHLIRCRQEYRKARIDAYARVRPLTSRDSDGCTCGSARLPAGDPSPDCMYHYAAALQPWNHRIPWNCLSYYDGCNCPDGPGEMPS